MKMMKFKTKSGRWVTGYHEEVLMKLEMNNEEIELIMKHQERFPELLREHKDDEFVINMRNLWEQLGKPHGRFDKWVDRKVLAVNDVGFCQFIEGRDYNVWDDTKRLEEDFMQYTPMDNFAHTPKKTKNGRTYDEQIRDTPYGHVDIHKFAHKYLERRPRVDYCFTVDAAKHVALAENTVIGREFRQYFVTIEKAFRRQSTWDSIREPEKQGYKELMDAMCRCGIYSDYKIKREANMINRALTGYSAEELRQMLDITDIWTRDHLDAEMNKVISELQQFDVMLIESNKEYKEREQSITTYCSRKYGHLKERVIELSRKIKNSLSV